MYPTYQDLVVLSEEFGMDVSPLAPSAEGGGDQRFLAIVVKLTELDGRHIKGPHAFERVSFFCNLTVSFFS